MTYLRKRGACVVGDHILGDDRARYPEFNFLFGDKPLKDLVKGRFCYFIAFVVVYKRAGAAENSRAVQKLAGGKRCAFVGTLAGGGNVLYG